MATVHLRRIHCAAADAVEQLAALRARLAQLWNPPAGASNPEELVVLLRIKLRPDGRLADGPMVLTSAEKAAFEGGSTGAGEARAGRTKDAVKA